MPTTFSLNQLLGLQKPLVLASRSPRRQALLSHIGLSFDTVVPDVDEDAVPTDLPHGDYVETLALMKARRGAHMVGSNATVIGSDTTVILDGIVLNKPLDPADAARMLRMLSGRTHTVYTGLALVDADSERSIAVHSSTRVAFRELDDAEIAAYVESGSPLDKAGAYGIQDDFGAVFVRHVEGCYYTIVGLPLELLYSTLKKFVSSEQRVARGE